MKLILLSGGSGKRLWPLSNDARSKQFLKVLKNETNTNVSMIQRVWKQLETANLVKNAIISTSKSQKEIICNQIGSETAIIVEPERRDTFPAIALAASHLYSVQKIDLEETVCILPVDPFVNISFFEKIREMEIQLKQADAKLALIGVKPTYPSEKYGYVIPKKICKNKDSFEVDYFKEKPSELQAKKLIEQNGLWNCGVFAFQLKFIISKLKELNLPTMYDELYKVYHLLPKISFDYEVVEKEKKVIVLPFNDSWKDLGTWNTLTEEMATTQIGKGIISKDSKNVHLINELDIPVTVLGASNLIVAVSPDGILVSDKEASPRIKELVGDFNNRPMYEERRWGWYRVLDYTKFEEDKEVLTKRIGVKAGKNLSYQLHDYRHEVWTIIKGEGQFVLNDKLRIVKPGDVLQIQSGDKHAIRALTDLEFIEVQSGSQLIEEDIVRLYMTWEEIQENILFQKA